MLTIAYILDFIISNTFNKGSDHDSWNYIYSQKGDCELAIFGSSRAINHINPKLIEDSLKIKTWNFDYEGQSIVNNYKEIVNTYRQWAERDYLPFIDFSNDSIYMNNKDTSNFCNCMHLNSKGADKFTSEMYVPWIKELYGL